MVSLNPIMIDGTGMCGGCRVLVDGKSQFACVDGPEFEAHQVNFDVLIQRNAMYHEAERRSMDEFAHEIEARVAKESAEAKEAGEPCAVLPGGGR
jgi:ferredoxin--NADP+ reductase